MADLTLAGGTRIDIEPIRSVVASNLTPHASGIGEMTLPDFVAAMRTGRTPSGRHLDPLVMPWPHYAKLTDRDLRAVFTYLQTLSPIANAIPATEEADGPDLLIDKLRGLRGDLDLQLVFHPGNAGTQGGREQKPAPQSPTFWQTLAVGLALGLAVQALYFWRPLWLTGLRRRRRRHRTFREVVRGPVFVLSVVAAVALILVARWMPAGAGARDRTVELYAPKLPTPSGLTGETARVAEFGRYLVGAAACGRCHTTIDPIFPAAHGEPLAGGQRVAWAPMGERSAANLTGDPVTGLGSWTPAQLKRALRTGLLPDGRVMHRAAMPWDFVAGLRAEELEAIVTYLKALSPVVSEIPAGSSHGGGSLYTVRPHP
jgi:mono/diheme cytochrome c family protein